MGTVPLPTLEGRCQEDGLVHVRFSSVRACQRTHTMYVVNGQLRGQRASRRGPELGGIPTSHDSSHRSALLRRLPHKSAELRRDSRALTRRAPNLPLLVLRHGHGQLERLLALLAAEFVPWHGILLLLFDHSSARASTDDGMVRRSALYSSGHSPDQETERRRKKRGRGGRTWRPGAC